MNTEANTHCPRCSRAFECRPHDISACSCTSIALDKEEYRFINSQYTSCLCNSCLKELRDEYNGNYRHRPYDVNSFSKKASLVFFVIAFSFCKMLFAQPYAPPAGQPGTSAMYMDSSAFVNWAVACQVNRGFQDISTPSLGLASVGDASMGIGKAQSNPVVSLGDGGWAICTFANPITNGPGYDLAVFENGFDDQFLELAFVEVSSDGVNFFRFHAHSLTDTVVQTSGFGPTDATKINNLAGKYRGEYGTPFDLQELSGTQGLDIDHITHVKIIDVVGSLDPRYATRDFYNNKVNDPWQTAFPSGGFDLDAVGVIHESSMTGMNEYKRDFSKVVYPNPLNRGEELFVEGAGSSVQLELLDLTGRSLRKVQDTSMSTSGLPEGIYFLVIQEGTRVSTQKIILR